MDLICCLEKFNGATTDNLFTDLLLAENLLHRDIMLCGTMRRNRNEISHELLPKKRKEVESSIYAFHDKVTLVF
jgi:hypothetical protein